MMPMVTIAERVRVDMALLDRERPGWIEEIDLETLDMGDLWHCVLGQVYRHYDKAPRRTVRSIGTTFLCTSHRDTWDGLERAWKRQIRKRLAAQP